MYEKRLVVSCTEMHFFLDCFQQVLDECLLIYRVVRFNKACCYYSVALFNQTDLFANFHYCNYIPVGYLCPKT